MLDLLDMLIFFALFYAFGVLGLLDLFGLGALPLVEGEGCEALSSRSIMTRSRTKNYDFHDFLKSSEIILDHSR